VIIRARAPLRLGLAGGGTDVSPYADLHGGVVMNVTINKYAYATLEPLDRPAVAFDSIDLMQAEELPLAPVLPTDGPLGLAKAVYNRVVQDFRAGAPLAVRLRTFTEAPPGSGLGSSSTVVVAALQAFVELLSLPLGEYDVAHLAYEIEREDMALRGGRQDQYAATFGGFNFMEFGRDGHVVVNPLKIKDRVTAELEASMLLCFTGVSRASADIIAAQARSVASGEARPIEAMHRLKANAYAMKEALLRGDLDRVAAALQDGWLSKRDMASSISTPLIEELQQAAIEAGARAGKVSGAGGGGFMFFLAPLERRRAIAAALTALGGRVETCQFSQSGAFAWRMG